jgi:WD40 repeat protein
MTTVAVGQPAEAPNAAEAGRYDAFISYSRRDSAFTVDTLVAQLRAAGKEVWLDLDISGGAKWLDRVNRGIEACKSLIFIVSPNSVSSEACRHELDDAVALNKLIIPVIHEDVRGEDMPPALSEAEWVFLRDSDDHAAGMKKLVEALEADLEWRDQHTRLAGRAREWLDSGRNNSYLLRGADLRGAETWLADHEGHREAPTREQVEYITRSRQAAGRRLYTLIGALATGLAIAIVLAIIALVQRSHAVHQTHVAQSRLLAARATNTNDLQLASLMALEAYKLSPTLEAKSAILQVADTHQLGAAMGGGTGGVNQVAISPNGATIASATDDGAVQLWDATSHRRILPDLTGHTDRVHGVAFSPDGKELASASFDKTLRFWSTASHRQIGPAVTAGTNKLEAVAFSPDGKVLATGGDDRTVRLWDVTTHREIGAPLRGHTDRVQSIAFSPDGRLLASGSVDDTVRVWDVASSTAISVIHTPGAGVAGLAFSPGGKTVAGGLLDHNIMLWDVASGRTLATLTGHTAFVLSVAFSPDGQTLASAGYDSSIRLWSVRRHAQIGAPLAASNGFLDSVVFTRDGGRLISGGGDGAVREWTLASSRQVALLAGHTNFVNAVAFSPDGKVLASAGDDHKIVLWDVGSHGRIRELSPPVQSVTGVAFSPDGSTLASAQIAPNGGSIAFWDARSGQLRSPPILVTPSQLPGGISIAYSPDGRLLAFVTIAGVGLIRTENRHVLTSQRLMPGSLTLAFSPDSHKLAVGGPLDDDAVRLLSVSQQRSIGDLGPIGSPIQAVAWSPDGKTVASGAGDNLVRLWDVATRRQISLALTGHTGEINSLAFSPDGRTLASASADRTIRLWDIVTRRQLGGPLTGHAGPVASVAFSRDGRTLASGGEDDTVRLWTTAPIDTYIRQLCGYVDQTRAPQLWRLAALSIPYAKPC